jgi:adenosylhomocysteine nucleosidase
MYAFSAEGKLLKDRVKQVQIDTVLGREAYGGRLENKSVVICGSGVGMTNAAMMTQKLIDRYRPQRIVFSGIAGALDTAVAIGDLVVCSTWVTHDFVYWGRDSIQVQTIWSFSPAEDSIRAFKSFSVDSVLFAAARMTKRDSLSLSSVGRRTPQIHIGGVGVSGNAFVDNKAKRQWLTGHFGALITDMESAAVVQVCHANDVPCLVVRSASDLAGGSDSESAGEQLEQFFKVAASNSAVFVMGLLREM